VVMRRVAKVNDPVARLVRCRDRSRRANPDSHQSMIAKAATAATKRCRDSGKALIGSADRRVAAYAVAH
jgi:hypothetical protein